MAAWTFAGATFHWLRNGNGTMPTWKRKPRQSTTMLIGTGNAEINQFGFEPYRITGEIWIETEADYILLEAANGLSGSVSDGTTTWTAVLELDVDSLAPGPAAGYTGPVTFTRPRPTEA